MKTIEMANRVHDKPARLPAGLNAKLHQLVRVLIPFALLSGRAFAQPVVATATVPAKSNTEVAGTEPQSATVPNDVRPNWIAELARLENAATETAQGIVSQWLDELSAGKIPPQFQLEVLEAAQKHSNPAIKDKLARYNNVRLQQGGMATQSELLYGGDPANGRKVFFEHQAALCFKCHRVGNEGGDTGPALTGVGSRLKREELLESILFPDAKIAPGYETVLVRLKDRSGHAGVLKHETDTELTLDCPPDGLLTIKKSEIILRRQGGSVMPDEFAESLTRRQLRDLVAFLAQLK